MSNALPGEQSYLEERVKRALEAAGRKGLVAAQLAARLDQGQTEVEEALASLGREGVAVERNGRWLALRFTDFSAGTVERLESGDALVRTGLRDEAGYFVPRRRLKGAIDGDLVLVQERKGGRRKSPRHLPEATVIQVLHRRFERLVGTLERDDRGWRWLVPFDPKLSLEVAVEGGEDLADDEYVVVELDRRSTPRGDLRGRVVEVLGSPEVPGVDALVVLRHYGIPDQFPSRVVEAARAFPNDPEPGDWEDREDLRDRLLITIDGETARDFDDAVSVEPLSGGGFLLGVHIADVAHYVREGDPIDLEAYRRGTSVYYPDGAIHMLPEALSAGLCSLRPGVPRLALSVFLEMDGKGRARRRRFAETVIESARRMTYTEVRRLLEEPVKDDSREYGEVLPMLRQMRELMEILLQARMDRGSIDFDLPEGDVILDTDGYMVGIRPGERNVAHRIIEEFMIAANEAVAFELVSHDCPALFRIHELPERQTLEELREVLASLGIPLKGDLESLHPSALQEVLARVHGQPEEGLISTLVLRAMQRAVYSPECRGHYALASRHYTHFTSPIRRYPDLVVHRRLKALLRGDDRQEAERTLLPERLPGIADHASFTERRAEASERDLLQWKKVRFLARRAGETFPGHITGVQPFGLFVQLDDYYVDGFIPIRTLEDDYYHYEPEAHRLVGDGKGRVFRLADAVQVVLVGVDLRRRSLDLKLVEMAAATGRFLRTPRRRERSRRGRR